MPAESLTRSVNHWEELRREARQVENEIDSKLLSLSKLASKNLNGRDERQDDTVPLISATNDGFGRIVSEIDVLLKQLNDINGRMSQYAQQMQNASAMYTLQRHREILTDYTNEFHKTKMNIQAIIEREQLLAPVSQNDSDLYKTSKHKTATDVYLKENEHIRNSERLVDEQITVAMRTRDNLLSQRNAFKAIQTQLTTLANRFPVINSVMQKINVRRRKDSIILGCVIGICLTFLILYIF